MMFRLQRYENINESQFCQTNTLLGVCFGERGHNTWRIHFFGAL
jgi:hypothetical protein